MYTEEINKGVSPFEAFLKFLKTQHNYFSKITDQSAKIYAEKFEELLKKEQTEIDETNARSTH